MLVMALEGASLVAEMVKKALEGASLVAEMVKNKIRLQRRRPRFNP